MIDRLPIPRVRGSGISPKIRALAAAFAIGVACASASGAEAAESPSPADAVYLNGRFYTVDETLKWADAVAVRGGRFIEVGSRDGVLPWIGKQTRVVDLGGRMAMPGIHDLHIHALDGALPMRFACPFRAENLEEVVAKIKACTATQPPGEWIRGGFFNVRLLDARPSVDRALLDAVAPNHQIVLRSAGGHASWANSAALRAAGIDRNTPDPVGGVIGRDATTGESNGLLFEAATQLVQRAIPDYTPAQNVEAVAALARDLNRRGVTSIKDAAASESELRAFLATDHRGLLTLRVATARTLRTGLGSMDEQLAEVINREQYRTARINPDFAKIFVDGSAGARRAAFLDPYENDPQQRTDYRGEFLVPRELLKEYVARLDKAGVSVKMHCGGDAARRAALDAIEYARRTNGDSGIPHEIAHPALLHPDDIPRFRSINAIADLTPVAWYPNAIIAQLTFALGEERGRRLWQIRTMVEAGTTAVYGSDWPGAGPSINPWRALEAMVTRRNPDEQPGAPYSADEAIDLATAIKIFTRNGAEAMRHGDRVGTIATGKLADFIVLREGLFDIPPERIDATEVLLTVLEGEEVHRDPRLAAP